MQKLLSHKKITFGFIIGILLSFFLFFKTFSSFYFQDDWFSLGISRINNIIEFLNFFNPRSDIIYFRPLGMQVPFFIIQNLFGLNPFPFKILTFLIHVINGYIVFLILNKLFNNEKYSILGSMIYLTSSAHLTIFYWLATFAFILGPFFYFLAFYFFLIKKPILTWIIFIFGLLTNEMVITFPLVILLFEIFKNKKFTFHFIIGSILVIIYFGWRFLNVGLPFGGSYSLSSELLSVIKNIRNYLLWMLNWPEEIQNQYVSFLSFNSLFIKEFIVDISFFVINSIFIFGLFTFSTFKRLIFSSKKIFINNYFLFGITWFLIALLPVLFFSNHAYAYYLPIPFLGIIIALLDSWQEIFKKFESKYNYVAIIILIIFWFLSSWKNIQFNYNVHWAPRRAKISAELVKKLLFQFPTLPNDAIVVIPNNDENKWALGDQNALNYLYWKQNVITFYGKEKELQTSNNSDQNKAIFVKSKAYVLQ